MAEYTGKALYITFGTIVMNADYRKLTVDENIGLKDASAGADTNRTYLTELKDGTGSVELVDQTAGTVLWAGLEQGTEGTLLWAPEGTASTKPKHSVNAIVKSRKREMTYDDVTKLSFEFQFSGAVTDSVY